MTNLPHAWTLANLPTDIIRIIARMNIREQMDKLALISPRWSNIIGEYLNSLPYLYQVELDLQKNVVILVFNEKYLKHFQLIDFKSQRIEKDYKDHSMINKYIDFNTTNEGVRLLAMIFQLTNEIRWMYVEGCGDKNTLEILAKAIRPVLVDGLCIVDTCTTDIRETIKKMILRHGIHVLHINSRGSLYQTAWGNFIHSVADSVPVLYLEFGYPSVSENLKLCWEHYARSLINERGIEKVVVYINTEDSEYAFPYYREPWLEFMDLFQINE